MMRRRGGAELKIGSAQPTHIGWGYHDRAEFLRRAAEFIGGGLARNELVHFVAEGSPQELRSELAAVLGEFDGSHVCITPALEFYPTATDQILDPIAAVATLEDAARRAIAEGYNGLCIVGDATCLVRRSEGRHAFARYEFLADRAIAELPIAAMCAFDVTELGPAAAELVCLHPEVGETVPDFRLHSAAGVSFAISGEIDSASTDLFTSTLERVWPLVGDGHGHGHGHGEDIILDVARLDFLDHNVLMVLDQVAGTARRRVLLRGAGPVVRRLIDLLQPLHTVIESAA